MRTLVPILILLGHSLSACSPSQSAETLLRGLPIVPEATPPRQSGSMLEYSAPDPCSEVAAFYQTEMRSSGWTLSAADGPGDSWSRLEFAKERDTAEIHLSADPLGRAECRVQVFYLEYSLFKDSRTQSVLAIAGILGMQTAFAYLCGHVSMGKGRHPALGWILGFLLGLMAYLFIIGPLPPRRGESGRMIHWREYKLLTKEEKAAIRPLRAPPSQQLKMRRILVVIFAIIMLALLVLQVLRNLGRL